MVRVRANQRPVMWSPDQSEAGWGLHCALITSPASCDSHCTPHCTALYTAPHPFVQNCTSVKIEKFCNWNISRYLLNYPMSFFLAFMHFQAIYNPIMNYTKFLEPEEPVCHSDSGWHGVVTLSVTCSLYEYNLITSHKAHIRVSVSLKLWVAAFIPSPDFWCLLRLAADALMHEPSLWMQANIFRQNLNLAPSLFDLVSISVAGPGTRHVIPANWDLRKCRLKLDWGNLTAPMMECLFYPLAIPISCCNGGGGTEKSRITCHETRSKHTWKILIFVQLCPEYVHCPSVLH